MKICTTTHILVLSKQLLYIEALKSLLNSEDEILANGYPITMDNIRNTIMEENPNIILLDANGMGKEIWDFLYSIHSKNKKAKIIMLANSNESIYMDFASKNGADGYVLKSSPLELLLGAIKIVLNGGAYFDPGQKKYARNGNTANFEKEYKLSNREMEIITLIKDGESTKSIAERLDLSFHTIETHRKNIYRKLGIHKVTELINLYSEFER
ncbi:LuxR C-terminal-related transcriptional regulator [Arcticibacterium luteifluviistationis]|uniref:DNA-binding response regulator n=1 Tax=Arcticibacterium luteifluviistationis TaxID=1784714 RepID=A0A2Z4GC84_9BACT|nr:response regulator transcription factor [Arcticibacterium luteifluviistationis]AWV98902.1 hypothetical protein DJ013_12245 [Arcticibacterium luteifluviistationis]